MRPSAFLFVVACLSLFPSLVTGQTPSPAPNNKYAAPYYLDCGRMPPYQSRSARTPILSSPDGQKEAYAEASARAQGDHCSNRSAVFVRQNGHAFELIFLQQPEEMLLGNGVRIIDWSKDGTKLKTGETFGTVESVKAVSDIYAPVSGEVTEVNSALAETPETINKDPHGKAWLIKLKLANPSELAKLMNAAAYEAYVADKQKEASAP